MSERLLRLDEVADRLSLAVCTVRAMVRRGELSVVRVGQRSVRVDPADLADYERVRRTGARLRGVR